MKSLKTRVATGALAGAMALSLAVPAFAAGNQTKVTATYAEIPIDVTVPTAGTATLNPLGMPVTLVAAEGKNAAIETSAQIANVSQYIQNNTNNKLAVRANVSTVTKVTLVDEWPTTEPTDKTALVYLQVTPTKDAADAADADKVISSKGVVNTTAIAKQAAVVDYSESVDDETEGKAVVFLVNAAEGKTAGESTTAVPTGETKKASLAVLEAKSTTKDGTTTYNPGSIGVFGLYGKMVDEPMKEGESDPWTKADNIVATIAWQFSVVKG